MKIDSVLTNTKTLSELHKIVTIPHAHLSFWGQRSITVDGFEGSLHIDDLASWVINYINQNPHFDELERASGAILAKMIDKLYEESDQQVKQTNLITRIFTGLRECHFPKGPWNYCHTRWHWKDAEDLGAYCYNQVFDFYTDRQFEVKFGFPPEGYGFNHLGGLRGLPRWNGLTPTQLEREKNLRNVKTISTTDGCTPQLQDESVQSQAKLVKKTGVSWDLRLIDD